MAKKEKRMVRLDKSAITSVWFGVYRPRLSICSDCS